MRRTKMKRILWLLLGVVTAAMVEVVRANDCRTRSGVVGRCGNIRHCPELRKILVDIQNNRASPGAIQVLRGAVCDFQNGLPMVCCPIQQKSVNNRGASLLPKDCGRSSLVDKIIGGVNAPLNQWPWITLLRGITARGSRWFCGGVLISDRYVLTAAHCLDADTGLPIDIVRLGEHTLSTNEDCEARFCAPPPQDRKVEEVIIHERYKKGCSHCNDIALLRLAIPAQVNSENVVPVCLPFNLEDLGVVNNDFSSLLGWVAGWGTIDPRISRTPDVLQEVLVPLGTTSLCNKTEYPDPNMVLCSGGEGGSSCRGDSGGPVTVINDRLRYYAVGIVSKGPRVCGRRQTQSINTNVNYYLPWILSHLRP